MIFKQGEIFCGCEILCQCGRGAYGITYLARNPIGQNIIIKVVNFTPSSERELNGLRNYMAVSGTHENLLKIFHIGELEETFYYTMEAADNLSGDGEYRPATLSNILKQGKRFQPEKAIELIKKLLAGVKAIHDADLIHRDIKPDNIIFVKGVPKLSDPGLVVALGDNPTFAGTPGFIPPELIESPLPPNRNCDLYALGKVFYCMITGLSPRQYPALPDDMPTEICRQLFPVLCKMCDRNPNRRFRTVEEFSAGLPEKINEPTAWDIRKRDFNDWKILNPFLYRVLLLFLIFILILPGAAGIFIYRNHQKQLVENAKFKKQTESFLAINQERRELIELQLHSSLPELLPEYLKMKEELVSEIKKQNWKNSSAHAAELHDFLKKAAKKLQPEIPEKFKDFRTDFDHSGTAHSFLATPLFQYLDRLEQNAYRKKLSAFDRLTFRYWQGLKTGENWGNFQDYAPFIFIPAGAVKMMHSKKIAKIPYHFWMAKNETLHSSFTWLLGIAPQKSPHPNTPVERVSWNDILFYCHTLTGVLKKNNALPPGYIARPPTEAEWEYAANNGWLGKDNTPFEQRSVYRANSRQRTEPPGSKLPNKLGISDIYGNVYEIVYPLEKPAMHHAVMLRGGSFRSTQAGCFRRIPYLAYQAIPFDIGFRVVVAPGDMSFFDRHFFAGGSAQEKIDGKIYELVGANIGTFDWDSASEMCTLLGGRLAEIDSPQLFDRIMKKFPLAGSSWGCFVGGKKINGKWQWLNSGKEINYGKWHEVRKENDGDRLIIKGGKWKAEKQYHSGIFLCEWDEKDYLKRNRHLATMKKLPFELTRFEIEDKVYLLFESSVLYYTAARICELLGGRLAIPDSPELQKQLAQKLENFKDRRILLGGYAKRDRWFWADGKEITFPLLKHPAKPIPSRNLNFVIMENGKFYNSQYSSAFLCEFRKSSLSLN